jgi:hypothetical protein
MAESLYVLCCKLTAINLNIPQNYVPSSRLIISSPTDADIQLIKRLVCDFCQQCNIQEIQSLIKLLKKIQGTEKSRDDTRKHNVYIPQGTDIPKAYFNLDRLSEDIWERIAK